MDEAEWVSHDTREPAVSFSMHVPTQAYITVSPKHTARILTRQEYDDTLISRLAILRTEKTNSAV